MKKVVGAARVHAQHDSSNCSDQIGLGQDSRRKENVVEPDQRVLNVEHFSRGPYSSGLPQDGHRFPLQRLVEAVLVEGECGFALDLSRTFADVVLLQKSVSVRDSVPVPHSLSAVN